MRKSFALLVSSIALGFATQAVAAGPARPLTRAQVQAELAELQAVGYSAGGEDRTYPQALQEALTKVEARRAMKMADASMQADMREMTMTAMSEAAMHRGVTRTANLPFSDEARYHQGS